MVPIGVLLSWCAMAQAQHPHSPEPSAYSDIQSRSIKALSDADIESLRLGRGASLALPAELNGYPGPLHTLQFAEQLRLTPAQKQRTEALFRDMKSEAQGLGAKVIEAEAALDRLFASGNADVATVRVATARAAELHGELRAVHLRYHIAMRELLTARQIAEYGRLRGYGS
jgi:Spy/CpxP family protein refolding chaperone